MWIVHVSWCGSISNNRVSNNQLRNIRIKSRKCLCLWDRSCDVSILARGIHKRQRVQIICWRSWRRYLRILLLHRVEWRVLRTSRIWNRNRHEVQNKAWPDRWGIILDSWRNEVVLRLVHRPADFNTSREQIECEFGAQLWRVIDHLNRRIIILWLSLYRIWSL